ncbi:MAG TPA: hypothetical protein VK988_19255 [Acidimicrobiales bacterium]|nr:hypothetical protein [Acidimicrobiales bacterium]
MEIHKSARRHGLPDDDIRHAIDNAVAVEDAGEDPDRWLIIGPDRAGNLLEVVVLITEERPAGDPRDGDAVEVPEASSMTERGYGRTKSGKLITDADIEEYAAEPRPATTWTS